MTVPIEHVVTADGVNIGVRSLPGVGNPVVALHGFTGDGSTMLPLLNACRAHRPALAIDLIGHGASDSPNAAEHYAMSSVVDQVLSVIGSQDPATVHLLGYSLGGRVALSMAARAPWYFKSVITIGATPGLNDPGERMRRHEADQSLASHLEDVGVRAFINEWLALPIFAPYVNGLDVTSLTATVEQRGTHTATGLANSLRYTGTGAMPPLWQDLPALRSPLLAIAGELDEKYVAIAKLMAQTAPMARAEIVTGAGHVTHQENCKAVASLITAFLEGCEHHADR